jgi:hypothetical protein
MPRVASSTRKAESCTVNPSTVAPFLWFIVKIVGHSLIAALPADRYIVAIQMSQEAPDA